ncbi:hypothetical protein Tco_0990814 [Tanacetum coccineum]|uniref:Reverse transcriptase domain-containing protein n=1 Tax=Tanacetum coccineum TaxID=301880 RepID=A0ABQ5EXU0_9ASTR
MRTRSQSRNLNRQQQQAPPAFVEPFNLEEPIENPAPPVVTMDDTRTMAQLLEAPTEGYEDAIVVPEITADNFELKHGLLTLVQNKQFFGHDKEDPYAHISDYGSYKNSYRKSKIKKKVIRYVLGIVGINHCNMDNLRPSQLERRQRLPTFEEFHLESKGDHTELSQRGLIIFIGTMAGVNVDTLTMEQYLELSRENQAPGVVRPEIEGNVNFEIKSQFMRELREDTFSENKDEDAQDHIDRVLSIVGLFNIPGVSKDAVMLRVFPFTLTGFTKSWADRLAPGTINTWDLLKKAFI